MGSTVPGTIADDGPTHSRRKQVLLKNAVIASLRVVRLHFSMSCYRAIRLSANRMNIYFSVFSKMTPINVVWSGLGDS